MNTPYPSRSLSTQEGQLVAWLEAERRATVTPDDVAEALDWPRLTILKVLARLAEKGWLIRVANGRYETVLAETGGFSLPNPWAALSLWRQPYYVGYLSAAYELGLTPDRPGDVQTCVPDGARRPLAWREFPIALIWQRGFSRHGAVERETNGFQVWMASAEKLLVDGGVRPSRMGGLPGLVRVLDRAHDQVDWREVVALGRAMPRGRPALRRLAHLLIVLQAPVPRPLHAAAAMKPDDHPILLGEKRLHGGKGELDHIYGVTDNIGAEGLREEARH